MTADQSTQQDHLEKIHLANMAMHESADQKPHSTNNAQDELLLADVNKNPESYDSGFLFVCIPCLKSKICNIILSYLIQVDICWEFERYSIGIFEPIWMNIFGCEKSRTAAGEDGILQVDHV